MRAHREQFNIACSVQLQEKLKAIRYGITLNGAYNAAPARLNCSLCAQIRFQDNENRRYTD